MHVCPKVAFLSVPSVVAVVVKRRGSELSLSHSNCSLASRPPSPSSHGGKIGRLQCKFGKNVFNFALIAAAAACSGPGDSWHPVLSPHHPEQLSSGVLMLVMCGGNSCEKL